MLMNVVTQAAQYDLPVVAHIYPRDFHGADAENCFDPKASCGPRASASRRERT